MVEKLTLGEKTVVMGDISQKINKRSININNNIELAKLPEVNLSNELWLDICSQKFGEKNYHYPQRYFET